MTWAELPLLRLLLPFLSGIIIAFYAGGHYSFALSAGAFLIFITSLIIYFFEGRSIRLSSAFNYVITLLVFICGYLCMHMNDSRNSPVFAPVKTGIYQVILEQQPLSKGKWNRCKAEVEAFINGGRVERAEGMVILYYPSDLQFGVGQRLIITLNKLPLKNQVVPGRFDYSSYLEKQNIHAVIYLKKDQITELKDDAALVGLSVRIAQWRERVGDCFKEVPLKERNKGLLLSLVFGFGEQLDEELKSSFSVSGTLHVLSVSGMHLALIYILFIRIFQLLRIRKNFSLLIVLAIIWIYAGITGFSASVLRAAVMCTFLVLGELTGRLGNPINALAGSCILLLSVDPFLVFHPGFQLSYMAVSGIILFQPLLNELWEVRNKWLKEGRGMMTVTLSAQLTTFPISMMYFGQFPVYFLLANLIIVPFSSLLLYAGILYFFLFTLNISPAWMNSLTDLLCDLFCKLVSLFSELPGALISNSFLDLPVVIILYFFLLSAILFMRERIWRFIFSSSILAFVFTIYLFHERSGDRMVREVYIYTERNSTFIHFKSGPDTCSFRVTNRSILTLDGNSENVGKHYFLRSNVLVCHNKVIVLSAGHDRYPRTADVVIFPRLADGDRKRYSPKAIVCLSGSARLPGGLPDSCCWNLREKGAFIMKV